MANEKQIIEKSIKINGLGYLKSKTIFNIEDELEKLDLEYQDLKGLNGRKITIFFTYLDETEEKSDRVQMSIPFNLNEDEVKDFIIEQINNKFTL
jgi:hypothetical protein